MAVLALIFGTAAPSFAASAPAVPATAQTVAGGPVKTSLAGFNAGNIISDAVFTNELTMTEAQIQTFFNSKVKTCRGGIDEDGRPIVCLKDYKTDTVNRPADTYCKGYTGATGESAARIIYRVSQSCNINPQVLIVMLQKEQSLVTHTWPSAWRYDKALGQGCPDDAGCNPKYVGFFYQIYGAARQMQTYMEGRYFTWYAPGKTWNIQYHPNKACGTAPVYVANKATSALYYYTPYQPNAAALRAGYGTGDSCSSYGNRNFYNYFTDWFGSTQVPASTSPAVTGAIATEWQRNGGESGSYGLPTATAVYVAANGGGYVQQFKAGVIWKPSSATRAYSMGLGPYLTNYRAAGAESGAWGWPIGEAECRLRDGGCKMPFQNGTGFYSPEVASNLVPRGFDELYELLGSERSRFGYPKTVAVAGPSQGYVQDFQGGTIAYSPATRLVEVSGDTLATWRAAGGVNSRYGYPMTAMKSVLANGGGFVQEFTAGTVWSSSAGAFAMGFGPYRTNYVASGGAAGRWGWPTGDADCTLAGRGCSMSFQKGVALYSPSTGSDLVSAEVAKAWTAFGGAGVLGYPAKAQSSVSANGGGFVQEFTAGTVWSSSAGAFAMGFGPYRTNYVASGGAAGRWGWPTGDADCTLAGRGCSMSFQKGVALYSPSTGSDLVSAEVAKAWTAFGGAGVLGYPAKAQSSVSANGGGFVQEFTAGTVWSSSAGAFAMGFGPYRTNYVASGGAAGRWGWPAGEATCRLANGGCTMAFQTGVVAYSSGTASHLIPSGAILIEWMKRGGTSSTLGYPIAEAVTSNGLRSQRFEGGQIVLNTVTGTVTIR